MEQFWDRIIQSAPAVVDLGVVYYLAYRLLLLVRGSRAWRIIGGTLIYLALWFASDLLELRTLHYILDKALILAPVALVILLLPELRSALEGFGKLGFWPERLGGGEEQTDVGTIDEIVSGVAELSANSTGALIVIERSRKMPEIEANGVQINARVSAPLLCSLFYGSNPLHDGAVMIRGNEIAAAACHLPLTDGPLKRHLHLRHRAAVGATENTDAIALVISEERGTISIALDGRIREDTKPGQLRDVLISLLRAQSRPLSPMEAERREESERVAVP